MAAKAAPKKAAPKTASARKPAAKKGAAPAKAPAKATASAKKPKTQRTARATTNGQDMTVAQAKAVAPKAKALIGSKPKTTLRNKANIFGRLIEDHDKHRILLAKIADTTGDSPDRKQLFKLFNDECKAHAAAEEQALWSTVLRDPKTTDHARHAIAEHKELDDLLNDLAAADMSTSGWLNKFNKMREEYLHHIKEEEQEQFPAAAKQLSAADERYMQQVFNRRKRAEKAAAKITPKRKEDVAA